MILAFLFLILFAVINFMYAFDSYAISEWWLCGAYFSVGSLCLYTAMVVVV